MIPLQFYSAPGSHVVMCAFTLVGREPWQTPLNALLASLPKHQAPATVPTSLCGAAGLSEGMGQVEFGKGQGMGRRRGVQFNRRFRPRWELLPPLKAVQTTVPRGSASLQALPLQQQS